MKSYKFINDERKILVNMKNFLPQEIIDTILDMYWNYKMPWKASYEKMGLDYVELYYRSIGIFMSNFFGDTKIIQPKEDWRLPKGLEKYTDLPVLRRYIASTEVVPALGNHQAKRVQKLFPELVEDDLDRKLFDYQQTFSNRNDYNRTQLKNKTYKMRDTYLSTCDYKERNGQLTGSLSKENVKYFAKRMRELGKINGRVYQFSVFYKNIHSKHHIQVWCEF